MSQATMRFSIPHQGYSFPCTATITSRYVPRSLRLDDPESWLDRERLNAWCQVDAKVAFLNELLRARLPWHALITVRHSPGLFGAIVEAAEQRRIEAMRPYRRPAA